MKSLQSFALAVASTAALVSALATAKPSFVVRIPNGANVPGVDAVGHVDPTGSSDSLNSFGKAFKSNRERWNVTLCLKDSDGDGQTNGQELDDPCCYWSSTNLVTNFTTGMSDPGNSKSRVGEVSALSGGLSCCVVFGPFPTPATTAPAPATTAPTPATTAPTPVTTAPTPVTTTPTPVTTAPTPLTTAPTPLTTTPALTSRKPDMCLPSSNTPHQSAGQADADEDPATMGQGRQDHQRSRDDSARTGDHGQFSGADDRAVALVDCSSHEGALQRGLARHVLE